MKISICIPVYNSEKYLRRCLDSLAAQTFTDFEVVVIDDCSPGKDENKWKCKKICRVFSRQTKINVNCIRLLNNKGSMEARREAVYAAKGEYIFCIDCDDKIEPDTLEILVQKAEQTGSDIVQCGTNVVCINTENNKDNKTAAADIAGTEMAANLLCDREILGPQILDNVIIHSKINTFIWGKLIKRDLFIKAWEHIPPMYGAWGEDYLMVFYIAYFAKKYVGIRDKLYVYSIDTGISATQMITDIKKWEKFCTIASVFSAIFLAQENGEIELTEEQKTAIHNKCDNMIYANIIYLAKFVDISIREQAYNLLCEYCGQDYIEQILQASGMKIIYTED